MVAIPEILVQPNLEEENKEEQDSCLFRGIENMCQLFSTALYQLCRIYLKRAIDLPCL